MNHYTKLYTLANALLLVIFLNPVLFSCALAEGNDDSSEKWDVCMELAVDDGLSSDACFEAYVGRLFGLSGAAGISMQAKASLPSEVKVFYELLKPLIQQVAEGTRTSTVFTIDKPFTLSDAGFKQLLNALLADCPYDLYWFNKTVGISVESDGIETRFSFAVNVEYAAGEYEVDPTSINTAKAAVAQANEIIIQNASKTDYDKLTNYKAAICDLVGYDHDAAENMETANSNVWQLLWVFDGDDSTNVVCEGYSKAFQYLCNKTDFSNNISIYSVTGTMNGGAHMWNLVRMQNGKVYLVDVTNCDEGAVGESESLFMVGYSSGSVTDGYVIKCGNEEITYIYYTDTLDIFTTSDLTLSDRKYLEDDQTEVEENTQKCGDDIVWRFVEDGTLILSGSGRMWDLTDQQRASGEWLWPNDVRANVRKVIISEGITYIGIGAFEEMTSITEVDLPDSLKELGYFAFYRCSALKNIDLPEGLLIISGSFLESGLESVTIPSTVYSLGGFSGCQNLASVQIKAYKGYAYTVETGLFNNCPNLERIDVEEGHMALCSIDNVLFNNTFLLSYPQGKKDRIYQIPQFCTEITNFAFAFSNEYPASLEEVVIPEGCTRIASDAFLNCWNLTSITIPDSVSHIDSCAFQNCRSLSSITLSSSVSHIGNWAFAGCESLVNIWIDDNNTLYKDIDGVFFNADTSILLKFPEGRGGAYEIPEGTLSIDTGAFSNSRKLSSVVVPDSVVSIGNGAFMDCTGLESITLSSSISVIEEWLFYGCSSLTSINIPASVTDIVSRAFENCTALKTVVIPGSVKTIGVYTFLGCDQLKNVYYCGTEAEWNAIIEDNQDDALRKYDVHFRHELQWGDPTYEWSVDNSTVTARRMYMEDNAVVEEEIAEATIALAKAPTDNEKGETLYTVMFENEAFSIQTKTVADIPPLADLQVASLPSMLQFIEDEAFMGVISIEAVLIPDGCESIGFKAFANCPELIYIRIPASVSNIAENAFEGSGKVRIEWVDP